MPALPKGIHIYIGGVIQGRHDIAQGDKLWQIEKIIGTDFNDLMQGDSGDNIFVGGAGADTITGGFNADDSDTSSYVGSDAAVEIDLQENTITGGHATGDILTSIENLIGSSYDDKLFGGDEDNVFEGGAGADHLKGRGGSNTASYASSDEAVKIDRVNDSLTGGHATGDRLDDIENLIGSAHDDELWGNHNVNTITGGAGNDDIKGRERR